MKQKDRKKGGLGRMLKIVGAAVCVAVLCMLALSQRSAVPKHYAETVKTGGPVEQKYIAMGEHEVQHLTLAGMHSFKRYELWVPKDMTEATPAVIFVNGTGVPVSKYSARLEHLASWGFIAIGTEEEHAWNGFSAEMCYRLLERLDSQETVEGWKENPLYGKVDFGRIGISGHSQGGVGVINAVTDARHAEGYRAAFIASPTNKVLAEGLMWEYDASKVTIPVLLMSGTGATDETFVVSGAQLNEIYDDMTRSPLKILARRSDADHGDMLYFADGYMTAWFLWQLKDDADAAAAFVGDSPELLKNGLYQDQRVEGLEAGV